MENVASVIFTNTEDKIENVGTGEVFSVVNIDFGIVVLGYKEVISWDVLMGL